MDHLGILLTYKGRKGGNIKKCDHMWTGEFLDSGEHFCGETLEELFTDFIFRITGEEHDL